MRVKSLRSTFFWAKPVMVAKTDTKEYNKDSVLISLARLKEKNFVQ